MLSDVRQLLTISPGSTVLLRGHVDDTLVPQFRDQAATPSSEAWP